MSTKISAGLILYCGPALLLLVGIFLLCTPLKRNRLIGYRTSYSLSSDSAWRRANLYAGRIAIGVGLLLLFAKHVMLMLGNMRPSLLMDLIAAILWVGSTEWLLYLRK